jgi:WD40 repeat protein
MLERTGALVAAASLTFAAVALAVPLREKPRPAITAANAEQVRALDEIPRDVWKIVWGPRRDEVSFLGWQQPVEVLDAAAFKPVRKLAAEKRLIHFAASPDGNFAAWCENGKTVELHNLRTDKTTVLAADNDQPEMTFSPDGKLLATGGYGTQVKLWDVASGRLVRSLDAGGEGGLQAAFSPDGKTLAVGNRNDETRLYETATGKLLHTLPRKTTHEVKFSPSGRVLAVAYVDGVVGLWDASDGTLLRARATGAKEVYTLDWSPAGDVLATAGLGGKITLWDPRDLTALKELDAPEWVIQVRFSPDGARLLTAGGPSSPSPDRKVVLWGIVEDGKK